MSRSQHDERVRRYLRRSMVARIATLSPAGNPDIIPLWFVVHRGRILMGTRSENPVVRDLLVHPEVAILFHGEGFRRTNCVLRVHGQARFRQGRRAMLPMAWHSLHKYLLALAGILHLLENRSKLGVRSRYVGERKGGGVIEITIDSAEFLPLPQR